TTCKATRPADEPASCSVVSGLQRLTIEAVRSPMAFKTKTESELLERTFISSLFNSCFPSFVLSVSSGLYSARPSLMLRASLIFSRFCNARNGWELFLHCPGRGQGPPPRKRPTRLSRHLVPHLDCATCATISS